MLVILIIIVMQILICKFFMVALAFGDARAAWGEVDGLSADRIGLGCRMANRCVSGVLRGVFTIMSKNSREV